jgi:predicted nucleic acid-binding protein
MSQYLVLDSSIIVAALREQEEKHWECKDLLGRVKGGKLMALEPYSVLVEVIAAVRRRTGSSDLANRVKRDLPDIGAIEFVELTTVRAEQASEIAAETGVRGMDAIVIQLAREFSAPLVSLDVEMVTKAKSIVKIEAIEDLVR